ncbi:winged helix-turn-helix transcriptional regulator [Catellatospora chokoriensis]|uniref:Transcriptional regulator n=1 Tax=Catellatospora chokoriensis TaxID=310353 RepID=A0A8J3NPD3_9ACTN|nr:winged helix-turn-helix transcriptional regulator [Catellatospora chokoriensis]GIF87341.1 transcriptional regulator [Catellatospora chokoriensis]
MPKRLYGQLCPIARSLDVLGERWTLLIVRELLLGPRRFKELLTLLPAMGTNRLAERLQLLERSGVVVRRALPAASDVRAYELTAYGERLRPLLIELATWGNELPVDDEIDPGTARAELIALYLAERCPADAGRGHETYRFHVGDEVFHVTADDTGVHARSGPGPVPANLVVTCDLATFDALTRGELDPAEAGASGALTADGDTGALARAFAILRYRTPAATAA